MWYASYTGFFDCNKEKNKLFLLLHESMKSSWTSGQDGSIGRHGLPLCTTTMKLQLKHGTTITQNLQLDGILTTTELKKPHPSRLVGGAQMCSGLVPHPCVLDKNLGGIS